MLLYFKNIPQNTAQMKKQMAKNHEAMPKKSPLWC